MMTDTHYKHPAGMDNYSYIRQLYFRKLCLIVVLLSTFQIGKGQAIGIQIWLDQPIIMCLLKESQIII